MIGVTRVEPHSTLVVVVLVTVTVNSLAESMRRERLWMQTAARSPSTAHSKRHVVDMAFTPLPIHSSTIIRPLFSRIIATQVPAATATVKR